METINSNSVKSEEPVIKEADPMEQFKTVIAEQIASLSGILLCVVMFSEIVSSLGLKLEQVYESIEEPKKSSQGDLALPIPKLNKYKKLEGKPMDISKLWSEQVM